jgi:C4-dicarboxylate transporter, DctQ subunit
MSRIDRVLTLIENGLAGFSLAAATILAIVSVIARYLFDHIIFWSEEAVIYLIICSTFIGAVITLRHNEHVGVNVLSVVLGPRGNQVLVALSALLVALYCGIFGFLGWLMVIEPAARNIVTPALNVPLWVVQISLPIGLTLMFFRALEILYRAARGRQAFPEAEEDEFEEPRNEALS